MNDKTYKYIPGKSLSFKPWHAIEIKNPLPERRPTEEKHSGPPIQERKSFTDFPSYKDMVANLGGSIIRNLKGAIRGEELKLPEKEKNNRLDICKGCPHYHGPKDRCGLCGCKMAVKAYLKLESCPIGKW